MSTFGKISFLLDAVETFDYFLHILWRGSAVVGACLFATYLILGQRYGSTVVEVAFGPFRCDWSGMDTGCILSPVKR